jgi:hypothetical protein
MPHVLAENRTGGLMQVGSVTSQIQQQQFITNLKNQNTKPKTTTPAPASTDNDGDNDNGAPDKGNALDTKG